MANTKISALSSASTPLAGSEIVPINQSSVTDSVTVANLTAGRAVSALTYNGLSLTAAAAGYTIAGGTLSKTLTVNNTIALSGTDSTTMTFPSTNATIARTDAAQTFAGTQTFSGILSVTNGVSNNSALIIQLDGSTNYVDIQAYNYGVGYNDALYLNRSGGDVKVGANIIPTTAGKGINFTANTPASGMTSQLLKWYEEGTWTPSLGGTTTYSALGARYTRVGRNVTIQATILINAIGTGSTTTISGLPFTNLNGINGCSVGYFTNSATLVTSLMPYIPANGTTIIMSGVTVAAASITSPLTFFQNGTYLEISATYQCA